MKQSSNNPLHFSEENLLLNPHAPPQQIHYQHPSQMGQVTNVKSHLSSKRRSNLNEVGTQGPTPQLKPANLKGKSQHMVHKAGTHTEGSSTQFLKTVSNGLYIQPAMLKA